MADLEPFLGRHRANPLYRYAGFRLVSWSAGEVVMECPVAEGTQNVNGTLHGGIVALLVDEAGTVALAAQDRDGRPGVTTDLNVSFFAPGRPPSVRAVARVLKIGRTLGFVEVEVFGADGKRVAQGRMTKHLGP